MKKKLQKILAVVLAMSMCMSLLSISAFAADEESMTPSGATNNPFESGTALEVEVTVGTPSEPTVNENEGGGTTASTQQTDTWKSADSDDDSDSTTEPGTEYGVTGSNTTTTSEVKDSNGELVNTITNQTGSESITQTTTNTSDNTETGVKVEESKGPTDSDAQAPTGGSDSSTSEWTGDLETPEWSDGGDGWTKGQETSDNQPDISHVENLESAGDSPADLSDVENNALKNNDITINMTPGGDWVEGKTQELSVADVINGEYTGAIPMNEDGTPRLGKSKDANGNEVLVETVTENGVLVGYKVTTRGATSETGTSASGEIYDVNKGDPQDPTINPGTEDVTAANKPEGEGWTFDAESGVWKKVTTDTKPVVKEGEEDKWEPVTDDDGNITSWTKVDTMNDTNLSGEAYMIDASNAPKVGSNSTTENNNTTTVTVTEIKDAATGLVVGYKTSTVVTNANGVEISSSSQNAYLKTAAKTEYSMEGVAVPETKDETVDGIHTKVDCEDILDANGNLIGYKTTTVKTDVATGKVIYTGHENTYGTSKTTDVKISVDPISKQVVTTTNVTITKTETVQVEKQTGTVDASAKQDVNVSKEADVVTDQYQFITLKDENDNEVLYFIYQGKMYEVKDMGSVKEEEVHFTQDYTGMNSDNNLRILGKQGYKHDASNNKMSTMKDYSGSTGNENYSGQQWERNNHIWTGYGMHSSFVVADITGDKHSTKQFTMNTTDKNGKTVTQYLYCVELGPNVNSGASYSKEWYEVEEGKETGKVFTNAVGSVAQVRSVAVNGFWGSANGLGSLDAVKDLLIRNETTTLGGETVIDKVMTTDQKAAMNAKIAEAMSAMANATEEEREAKRQEIRTAAFIDSVNQMTEGHALTATQTALWEFGCMSTQQENGETFSGNYVVANTVVAGKTVEEYDQNVIDALHDLLVSLANSNSGAGVAEVIDDEDLTGTSITLKEKVAGEEDKYVADLGFTLAVSTSSINGDLVVQVIQNGQVVKTARLAGNDDGTDYGKIYPDKTGKYTIPGIALSANEMITLNLSGVQHLDDGLYVYSNSSYQDLVGLTRLEQNVNLTVNMEFRVEKPSLTHQDGEGKDTWTDTRTDEWNGSYEVSRLTTTTDVSYEMDASAEMETVVLADVSYSWTTEETTEYSRDWDMTADDPVPPNVGDDDDGDDDDGDDDDGDDDDDEITIGDDDVPLANLPEGDVPLVDMIDEEVPLVDIFDEEVPLTGDKSRVELWALLSLISGAGLIGLGLFGKKREEEMDA